MNIANIATTVAAAGGQIALAAYFGPQVTAAAAGVVGVVEYLKRVLPKIPATLTVLLISIVAGASFAEFDPAKIMSQALPILGASWLGYAGIITRFKKEEEPAAGSAMSDNGSIPKESGVKS